MFSAGAWFEEERGPGRTGGVKGTTEGRNCKQTTRLSMDFFFSPLQTEKNADHRGTTYFSCSGKLRLLGAL